MQVNACISVKPPHMSDNSSHLLVHISGSYLLMAASAWLESKRGVVPIWWRREKYIRPCYITLSL